jgi:hypothetical protein
MPAYQHNQHNIFSHFLSIYFITLKQPGSQSNGLELQRQHCKYLQRHEQSSFDNKNIFIYFEKNYVSYYNAGVVNVISGLAPGLL